MQLHTNLKSVIVIKHQIDLVGVARETTRSPVDLTVHSEEECCAWSVAQGAVALVSYLGRRVLTDQHSFLFAVLGASLAFWTNSTRHVLIFAGSDNGLAEHALVADCPFALVLLFFGFHQKRLCLQDVVLAHALTGVQF
jgi:hypothetical protein